MFPRRKNLLSFLWVIAGILACPILDGQPLSSFAAQSAASQVGEIFMTRAEEKEFDVSGKKVKVWVPADEKINFAWSDQPFAIHVPWDMVTEVKYIEDYLGAPRVARVYSKTYQVALSLRGFMAKGRDGASLPNILSTGLYRADGQPVFRNSSGKFHFMRRPSLPNLDYRPNDKPESIRLYGQPVTASGKLAYWIVMDPRARRDRVNVGHPELEGSLSAGIRDWDIFKDRCSGKISASIDVIENDKPVRVGSREYEIVLKQNGWEIRSSKVSFIGSWNQKVVALGSESSGVTSRVEWGLEDISTSWSGTKLDSRHRILRRPTDGPAQQTEVQILLDFPQRIWDHLPAEGSCKMSQLSGGTNPASAKYGIADVTLKTYLSDEKNSADPKTEVPFSSYAHAVVLSHGQTFAELTRGRDPVTNLFSETFSFGINPARGSRDPFSGSASTTVPVTWTPDKRIDSHRLITADIRYSSSATKRVELSAARLSDLENNRAGEVSTAAPAATTEIPDDGYWEWLARFNNELSKENRGQIDTIRLQLKMNAREEQRLRQRWFKLMRLDMDAHKPLNPERDDLTDYIKGVVTKGRSIPVTPTVFREQLDALKEERDKIKAAIDKIRPEQREQIDEALRLMKGLIESAELQAIRSKERRPEIKKTIESLQDELALLKLALYEDAGWNESDELQKVIEELRFSSDAVLEISKLMAAKASLAKAESLDRRLWLQGISPTPVPPNDEGPRAARLDAYFSLKEVLRINPQNQDARLLLKGLELDFVSGIAAKLDHEKQVSLAAFNRFLSDRGYDTKQPKDWWDGTAEFLYVWFGSGPTSLGAGFFGVDQAAIAAEVTDLTQTAVAKHHVSLLAIKRLLKNGIPLQKIHQITPEELAKQMSPQTAEGKPLESSKARRLCQDIHETFAELYDLRAIAEGDRDAISRFHCRPYYAVLDPEKTTTEFVTDFFFSPVSLMGWFLPGSIVKLKGRWLPLHSPAAGEIRLLEEAGQVMTVRQLFASAIRLEQLGTWLSKKPMGNALIEAIHADQALLNNLGPWMKSLNSASGLATVVTFYVGLGLLAEDAQIPALKMLVHALSLMTAEQMVFDILKRHGTPAGKVLNQLTGLRALVAKQRAELAEATKGIEQLERLSQKLTSSAPGAPKRLSADDIKQIEAITRPYSKPPTIHVPGANPQADHRTTIVGMANALKEGDAKEASRVLQAAKSLSSEMKRTLDDMDGALDKARSLLSRQPSVVEVDPAGKFRPIEDNWQPEKGMLATNQAKGPFGTYLYQGERALQKGDMQEALDLFRAARMEAGKIEENLKLADHRLALVACGRVEKEKLKHLRATQSPLPVDAPISQTP